MDNPFSADQNNPFQTPYQPQAPQASPGIKPFTAVDLAPPAGQPGQRLNAPGNPTTSAFTGGDFGSAFLGRGDAPMAQSVQQMPAAPAAPPAPLVPQGGPMGNSYTQMPAAPKPDFTPVAMSMPAAARQSQIISMSDFNEAIDMRKPAFFLTTTQTVDGYPIGEFLGIVSVEIVIPKDLLFRNPAPHGELHRLKSAEEYLQKVKAQAFVELGEKAKQMHADGVVGVTLAFSQFDAVVFLCAAVGTAVRLAD
ncbi:MAG: putative heavy-metal-binding [Fibrobacteres bacterium]|nr:putative heavy-metal-binding [Fibrobacterota bacterium]